MNRKTEWSLVCVSCSELCVSVWIYKQYKYLTLWGSVQITSDHSCGYFWFSVQIKIFFLLHKLSLFLQMFTCFTAEQFSPQHQHCSSFFTFHSNSAGQFLEGKCRNKLNMSDQKKWPKIHLIKFYPHFNDKVTMWTWVRFYSSNSFFDRQFGRKIKNNSTILLI